jgi:hypothetical protein
MESPYKCSKCELGAMVVNGELVKFCKCEAPVVTNIDAGLEGKSKVSM